MTKSIKTWLFLNAILFGVLNVHFGIMFVIGNGMPFGSPIIYTTLANLFSLTAFSFVTLSHQFAVSNRNLPENVLETLDNLIRPIDIL